MPKYIDHDYLPFTPVENRTMQVLEAKFDEIKLNVPTSTINIDKHLKIYINKRKTMVFMGLTRFDEERGSWILEVATWIKLDNSPSKKHRKVVGVHTREEITGKAYTITLYYSLAKAGIKLESDKENNIDDSEIWSDDGKHFLKTLRVK